jgi:Leucine-rich repeat (LRR) protein
MRLQFRSSFLAAVACVTLALTGCSSTPEEDARELLDSVGAKLRTDASGQIVAVDLSQTMARDDALAAIGVFPQVQTINCNGAERITGSGLAALAGLTRLESLYLANTSVDDAGLSSIQHLSSLTTLQLGGTKVTDKGMDALDHLVHLKTLSLGGTTVTDRGLVHLRDLRHLETISLRDTKTSKGGALELQRMLPDVRIVR